MTVSFGFWDYCLIAVVSLQATVLAYLRSPKWKAFLLSFPIPFSMAFLSLGRPVDATNVLGFLLLFFFMYGVWFLHSALHLPIVPAIICPALGYCLIGTGTAAFVSTNSLSFWVSIVIVLALALAVLYFHKSREESPYRSPLPVWIKLPIIVGVVIVLVVIKNWLKGFMTAFPMVSIVAAYEARHSLWTMSRQIPLMTLIIIPMLITMRLTQLSVGPVWALLLGWCVFSIAISLLTWMQKRTALGN